MRFPFVIGLTALTVALMLLPTGAAGALSDPAELAPGLFRTVDAGMVGTSTDPFGAAVELSSRTLSGTVSGSLGNGRYSGTLTNTGFTEPPPECFGCGQAFAVAGTMTFALRDGTITASVSPESSTGTLSFPSHFVELDFQLVLTIDRGTRRYQHAGGALAVSYRSLTQEGGPGCTPEDGCGTPFDLGSITGTIAQGPPFMQ